MRLRIPEIALGALLTLAVFAMGMSFQWTRDQATQANAAQKRESADQAKIEEGSFWGWVTHDAAGFFTLWLVIVGCGQAGLFVWQLAYMRKGMDDAKLAAEAARESASAAKEQAAITKMGVVDLERAYLALGPTQIHIAYRSDFTPVKGYYEPTDPKEVTCKLSLTNTGRTSATIKRVYGAFAKELPKSNTPVYPNRVSHADTDLALMAGESGVVIPFNFSSDFLGTQYFWGYVEYTDIFKNKRICRFCTRIFPEGSGQSKSGDIKFAKFELAGTDAWRECD